MPDQPRGAAAPSSLIVNRRMHRRGPGLPLRLALLVLVLGLGALALL